MVNKLVQEVVNSEEQDEQGQLGGNRVLFSGTLSAER